MATGPECAMCQKTASETAEGKLFKCPTTGCCHKDKLFCTECGIQSHSNHKKFDREFGGHPRVILDIQNAHEKAIIAKLTSTSKKNHAAKKLVGNSALIVSNAAYMVIEAGKEALKESGKEYGAKKLFEAGLEVSTKKLTKEMTKNAAKDLAQSLSKGAVGLQAVFCAYECAKELNRYNDGTISGEECTRLITRSVSANTAALGGWSAGAATGFAIGGGPGAFIGGVVGAMAADAGTRFAFDKWVWSNEEQKEREDDIRKALYSFQFLIEVDDVWDDDTFNTQQIEKQYRLLALENHPDRPNGSPQKFEKVLKHYNILLGVLKEKDRRNAK